MTTSDILPHGIPPCNLSSGYRGRDGIGQRAPGTLPGLIHPPRMESSSHQALYKDLSPLNGALLGRGRRAMCRRRPRSHQVAKWRFWMRHGGHYAQIHG
ncbi:MAG TPA: hypothetical protein VKP30_00785, partial [Polyangiaceae bacterium]|nr:hypothetical protein [Polyangiaceae bacterium]